QTQHYYYYLCSKHNSSRRSFSDQVFSDRTTGLVNVRWGPVSGGLYARHLQRWLQYFPPSRVHVVAGERLVTHPASEMQLVEKFLNLPPFITSRHFVFNKTKGFPCIMRDPSTPFNQRFNTVGEFNPLNGSNPIRPRCLGSTKGREHPDVDQETFRILQEFYRPFNYKFFRMINRNLDWD
ncbi:hypothetical protein HAZT_HAZT011491, partial [Hyalella azteca]